MLTAILDFSSDLQPVQMQYAIRYNHSSIKVFDFRQSSSFLVSISKVLLLIPTETRLLLSLYSFLSFPSLLEFTYLELSSLFSSSFGPLLEFLLMMTPELFSGLYLLLIEFIDTSPYFLPILQKYEIQEYSEFVNSGSLLGLSSIFSSSITGGEALQEMSSPMEFINPLYIKLSVLLTDYSCSSLIFVSFQDETRFFLVMRSQKKSMVWPSTPREQVAFFYFQLSLTRCNSSSIPYSYLIFLTIFLCLKLPSPCFFSFRYTYQSQSLSFIYFCTSFPAQRRRYLTCCLIQIFSILMLQKSFIQFSFLAHLLTMIDRSSMLASGGRSMMKLGARSMHWDMIELIWFFWFQYDVMVGWTKTTSIPFLSILRNSWLDSSRKLSTSYVLALLSRKDSFSLSVQLAITFWQELRLANLMDVLPILAKASRMTFAPLHLLAIYQARASEGIVDQESSRILIPSSNLSKNQYLSSQKRLNQYLLYLTIFSFSFLDDFLIISFLKRSGLLWIMTGLILSRMCQLLDPIEMRQFSIMLQTERWSSSRDLIRLLQESSMCMDYLRVLSGCCDGYPLRRAYRLDHYSLLIYSLIFLFLDFLLFSIRPPLIQSSVLLMMDYLSTLLWTEESRSL